eukprot:7583157-Alexandrium_andersonii.AAC.1
MRPAAGALRSAGGGPNIGRAAWPQPTAATLPASMSNRGGEQAPSLMSRGLISCSSPSLSCQ